MEGLIYKETENIHDKYHKALQVENLWYTL